METIECPGTDGGEWVICVRDKNGKRRTVAHIYDEQIKNKIITAVNQHEKLKEYKSALEGLTPGGSEYVDDPDACAEYIRQAMDHRERFKKLKTDREALLKALKRALLFIPDRPDSDEVLKQTRQAIAQAEKD